MDTAGIITAGATPAPANDDDLGHRRLVRSLIVACLAAGAWLVVHTP